jgi:PAB-dependent poly(A)-specific ribonuclease subunit 3
MALTTAIQLNYHLYTPLPYIQSSASSSKPSSQRFFLSDSLRLDLQKRSEALLTSAPLALSNLPEEVHTYHSLVPLEPLEGNRRKWFGGWASSVFKAVNSVDGITYCLRRIEGIFFAVGFNEAVTEKELQDSG